MTPMTGAVSTPNSLTNAKGKLKSQMVKDRNECRA
jgi:hypothetical protein